MAESLPENKKKLPPEFTDARAWMDAEFKGLETTMTAVETQQRAALESLVGAEPEIKRLKSLSGRLSRIFKAKAALPAPKTTGATK